MDKMKFYTMEETAEILRVTKQAVLRYIRAGRLRAAKLGRAWRIQEEDLNAFIEDAKKEGLKSPY